MPDSNWSAEPPNPGRNDDRNARQHKARQMDRAAHTAGPGKRRI